MSDIMCCTEEKLNKHHPVYHVKYTTAVLCFDMLSAVQQLTVNNHVISIATVQELYLQLHNLLNTLTDITALYSTQ